MFEDFILSSPKYKAMVFHFLKLVYEHEIIPQDLLETELVALYKKGDPKEPGNYRFIHIRRDISRILEMMIYEKLEHTFEKYTGKSQCGGMKDNDTIEHLLLIMSIIKDLENCPVKCIDCRLS